MLTFFLLTFTISIPSYEFNLETKELTIGKCVGEDTCQIIQTDYRNSGPFQTYRKITINTGPTSIGLQAFMDSSAVEEIYLSSWIQTISIPFCRSCSKLKYIGITSESQYFDVDNYGNLYKKGKQILVRSPPALTSFQLLSTTTIILQQAFQQAKSSTITITSLVTSIETGAFYDSFVQKIVFETDSTIATLASEAIAIGLSLTTIELPASLTHINDGSIVSNPVLKTISFPTNSKLIFIGENAIGGNTALETIQLPESVETISGGAFKGCTSLTTVHLSLSLKSLNNTAFSGCSSITTVTIPAENEYYLISNGCLYTKNMDGIILIPPTAEELEISDNLMDIGMTALQVCPNLARLIIGDNHPLFLKHESMLINKETMQVQAFVGGITTVNFPSGVKSLGLYCAYKCLKLGSIDVPETVTSIYEYCFSQSSITSINLPGVTSIGASAFDSCSKLETISFIESGSLKFDNRVFVSCSLISKLHFKCSVTSIPYRFCYYCGAKSVVFEKDGFTSIEAGSFESMTRLEYIDFPKSLITINSNALQKSCMKTILFSHGCGVQAIQSNSIYSCKYLENITFDSSLKTIDAGAFQGCSALESIIISDECPITEISRANIFLNCVSLKTFNVPKNVVKIEPSAFSGCTSLTNVTATGNSNFNSINGILYDIRNNQKILVLYPPGLSDADITDGVAGLGVRCFYECRKMTTIVFPTSTKFVEIGESVFYGCNSLSSLSIPKSVQTISSTAFTGCTKLAKVTFEDGSSLSSVGDKTFSSCSALSSINLEKCNNLITIPSECFKDCSTLSSIRIPSSVKSIEVSAFSGCSKLSSVIFESNNKLTEIKASAFSGCNFESITLPTSLETIGANAFAGSGLFDTLSLPSSVTAVGIGALSGCNLKHVIYCGLTRLQEDALGGTPALVHVTNGYPLAKCLGVTPERDLSPECFIETANPVHADCFLMCVAQTTLIGGDFSLSDSE